MDSPNPFEAEVHKISASGGAKGAYANALTLAKDVGEFVEKIKAELKTYGLELVEIEDAEKLEEWEASHDVSIEVRELADSIQDSTRVRFDAFYNYFSDEEVQ